MVLLGQEGMEVSIAEVGQEVAVVGQVAHHHHHFLMGQPQQMVGNCGYTFLVVPVL